MTSRPAIRRIATRHVWAVAVALLALCQTAAAAPGNPTGQEPPVRGAPNQPPKVVEPKASLAARADRSRRGWSPVKDQYQPSYVHPASWQLNLDGCGSHGGTNALGSFLPVRSYSWRLEPLDGQLGRALTRTTAACRIQVNLPKLGRWRTQLTITSDRGGRRAVKDLRFRDLVIVAFGDSFVSGEGNPEGKQLRPPIGVRVLWTDKQCHRSKHSWALRAARRLEDASTSVTFLNYACSGATTHDMLYGGYKGIQPITGDHRLPSQFGAARAALGGPFVPGSRPVHAVLMSAGVNDTEFSSVLIACASYNSHVPYDKLLAPIFDEPCSTAGATRYVRNAIASLRESYDRLEVALGTHLKAGQVRFLEYPSRVVTDQRDHHGGCGVIGGISTREARWITARGDELNAAMRAAARRHGWRYVGSVRDAFRRHGYCAGGKTWFRSFSGSRKLQLNKSGTAHPLGKGHKALAALAYPTISREDQTVSPPVRVRFEFIRARVDDPGRSIEGVDLRRLRAKGRVLFGVDWIGRASLPVAEQNFPIGRWVAANRVVNADTFGNTLGVSASVTLPALKIESGESRPSPRQESGVPSRASRSPRVRSTGLRRLRFFGLHRRADAWRPGTHSILVRGNRCSMQLEYKVTHSPYIAPVQR